VIAASWHQKQQTWSPSKKGNANTNENANYQFDSLNASRFSHGTDGASNNVQDLHRQKPCDANANCEHTMEKDDKAVGSLLPVRSEPPPNVETIWLPSGATPETRIPI